MNRINYPFCNIYRIFGSNILHNPGYKLWSCWIESVWCCNIPEQLWLLTTVGLENILGVWNPCTISANMFWRSSTLFDFSCEHQRCIYVRPRSQKQNETNPRPFRHQSTLFKPNRIPQTKAKAGFKITLMLAIIAVMLTYGEGICMSKTRTWFLNNRRTVTWFTNLLTNCKSKTANYSRF